MKKILNVLVILAMVVALAPGIAEAKGGSSGGRSGGGAKASSASRSASAPRATAPTPAPAPAPTPRPATPKPIPSRPTAATPTVTAAKAPVVNGKTYSTKGSVVGAGYQPRFRGGVVPPAGSTVYYHTGNDWMMWIPILYLLNNDAHRDAVVETPGKDGEAPTTQVVQEEGVDTMYVINWVVTILFALGFIALAVWIVNKFTNNKKSYV